MALPYDRVVIVFNPNSTGEAHSRAADLAGGLRGRAADLEVSLVPTEYAGHAIEIAQQAAADGRVLVVSASGDGGYNEVVNGVMAAGSPTAYAAVLPAGNANDHRRTVGGRPLLDAIVEGGTRRIDLLTVDHGQQADRAGGSTVRFAHSYVGLGLTPVVAIELEKGGKGSVREVVSTIRTFARFRPFTIETDNGVERFDSLIFANIANMAKFATLSADGRPDDGVFEVITIRHTAKWRVLATAVRAAVSGLGPQPTARQYRFCTVTPMPVQIDGELVDLDVDTQVVIGIRPQALGTVF